MKLVRLLLFFGILGVGIFTAVALVTTKPEAEKQARKDLGFLVEVQPATMRSEKVRIDAKGTVLPAREVVISPEVMGRVTWMAGDLVPGGRFKKGKSLIRLDGRDYRLAVEQQYAQVDRARTELEIERGRKKVAEREWQLFGPKGKKPVGPAALPDPKAQPPEVLALREPQMRTAKVAVKSAESGLRRARLTVSKTGVTAPFNAMVRNRKVEVGQLVGPNSQLATLVGTDAFWVQVSVPVDTLRWFKVPGLGPTKQGEGSVAKITQEVGDQSVVRSGRVVRLLGDVDPVGRMARILVEIEDPLALKQKAGGFPLLIGSYVRVEIEGESVVDVVPIPRLALREGNRVYLMVDGKLDVRDVTVVWRRQNEVLVSTGVAKGEQVIVSELSTPVVGMKLRLPKDETSSPDAAKPSPDKDQQ